MRALFLFLMFALVPMAALPQSTPAPTRDFAACLGRVSATIAHERLFGRDTSALDHQREQFAALLEAVAPTDEQGIARLTAVRSAAYEAQWSLLQTSVLTFDAAQEARAESLAQGNIELCALLLLG